MDRRPRNESWWGGDAKTALPPAVADRRRDRILRTLELCGVHLAHGASVLDFGCGDGALVDSLRRANYDAWGAEISPTYRREHVKLIDPTSGAIPFPDHTFDAIVSYTVLEHVPGDQSAQFDAFRRVLRRNGTALHFFPPRFGLIETHTMVPLASFVQCQPWLRLWAYAGVRAPHQQGLRASAIASQNHRFLVERTNYLSRQTYARLASTRFERVQFVEAEFVRATHAASARALGRVPFLWRAYGATRFRVLLSAYPLP